MSQTTASSTDRLRSDARRNYAQVLEAARQVILERGPNAPLDEIARLAGVGIGTLYRRFGDRESLLKAVVLDALERSRAAAEEALAGHDEGYAGLAAYLRAALDLRVAAVIPLVLDRLDLDDPELGPARDASADAVQALIDRAHDDGTLSREVAFGDVGTLLVRLSRPLPGSMPAEMEAQLAHRHLDLFLAGLRVVDDAVLEGEGLSRAQLGRASRGDRAPDRPD
ncbi:MAG TPA: helix-turn-helix domain-containing protein [Kribbellaceae bacterium]|nr:helix-turn-helix domain-containing protein [Kribbellaceae bacterium]